MSPHSLHLTTWLKVVHELELEPELELNLNRTELERINRKMARDSTNDQNTKAAGHDDRSTARKKEQRRSLLNIDSDETDERIQNLSDITLTVENDTEDLKTLIKEQPDRVQEWMRMAMSENRLLTEDFNKMETEYSVKINDLEKTNRNLNSRTKELTDALTERNRSSTSIEPENAKKRSVKLPDPEIFRDNKDGRIMQWLRMMKDKLKNNADHYPTENSKMAYVYSRVTGEAFDILEPRIDSDDALDDTFLTAEEVLKALEDVYGDKNRQNTARSEFRKLLQGKQEFQLFYAQFRRLAAVLKYDEITLIDELREKVNYQIQDALVGRRYDTLNETAQQCALIDMDVQKKLLRMNKTRTSQNRTATTNSSNRTSFQTFTPTNDDRSRTRSKTPRTTEQMKEEDKKEHMEKGKCFRCHTPGHLARDCPQRTEEVNEMKNKGKLNKDSDSEQSEN